MAVRSLGPGQAAVHHYELPTRHRGRVTVGPLVLERTAFSSTTASLGWVTAKAYLAVRYLLAAVVVGYRAGLEANSRAG